MEINNKIDIRALSLDELKDFFLLKGEKGFRARQVYEWLWKKSVTSFDEMTNISSANRDLLHQQFCIRAVKINNTVTSSDKTIKSVFQLFDGNLIEGVLIPAHSVRKTFRGNTSQNFNDTKSDVSDHVNGHSPRTRLTACISSQAGCSLSCKFCATGKLSMLRNLNADEIYDQVVLINKQAMENYHKPVSNIVYMGMGEPLLNYRNVLSSIEKLTSSEGLNISSGRITVSTVGIAKMIKGLADDDVKFNLAISLHAASDGKRSAIIPLNNQNPLRSLANALKYFYSKTGTEVTYEYIMFKNFNDTLRDAKDLAEFCKHVPCKVNLIEYNPVDFSVNDPAKGSSFNPERADKEKTMRFVGYLENKNILVKLRRSRGSDISAACGQLAIRGQDV